jgi:hypothetical protein
MNKKGTEYVWNIIFIIIVGVIAVFIVINGLKGAAQDANHVKSSTAANTKKQACLAQISWANSVGQELKDCDGDGYPDKCDICIDGDDSIDVDEDGMADGCEQPSSRNDAFTINCKFYEKESGACSVGPEGSDEIFNESKNNRKDVIKKLKDAGYLNDKDQYVLHGSKCTYDESDRVWVFEVNRPFN